MIDFILLKIWLNYFIYYKFFSIGVLVVSWFKLLLTYLSIKRVKKIIKRNFKISLYLVILKLWFFNFIYIYIYI